jgi:POT family proton-dependent oligopeptide transporter
MSQGRGSGSLLPAQRKNRLLQEVVKANGLRFAQVPAEIELAASAEPMAEDNAGRSRMEMVMPSGVGQNRYRRHPRALYRLVFAETWERFGYYGIQSLLLLYLVIHWRLPRSEATLVYGSYTSLAYGGALVGGVVADAYFGATRTLFVGGVLIVSGYAMIATQSLFFGAASHEIFMLGLAAVAVGTGLFKPSVATQVGALYAPDDPLRESGFYLFYVGINVGAAAAPLICGYVAERFSWDVGFAVAGLGMGLGLLSLMSRRGDLIVRRQRGGDPPGWVLPTFLMLAVGVAFVFLHYPRYTSVILACAFVGSLASLFRFAATRASVEERGRMVAIVSLLVAAAVWWTLAQQAGSTLLLFAQQSVDLHLGPIAFSAAQTQFFAPLFIVLGAPVIAGGLLWLARREREPGAHGKFAIGLGFAGLAFAVLAIVCVWTPIGQKVPLFWLVTAYLFQTIGELILAAPGLAALARLAPVPIRSQVMGIWLFTVAIGNLCGAWIAGVTPVTDGEAAMGYARIFAWEAAAGFGAALVMACLAPLIIRTLTGSRADTMPMA